MTQVFTAGSGLRGKVEQLMNLMETKIIYRQGGENIPLLNQLIPDLSEDELEQIPRLAQGYGIWRIGHEHPRMILPIAGPMWARVFDTSSCAGRLERTTDRNPKKEASHGTIWGHGSRIRP